MSTIIDKKFISILSPQLERFAWKRETLANCRCPICGDSEKNKSKCRGYFYQKENGFFYKCHNCGYGSNVYNFLKEVSPSLCKEYNLEKFKESATGKRGVTKEMLIRSKPNFKPRDGILDGLLSIDKLDKNHPAREFVKLRQIPKSKWNLLYYTDDFGSFMKKVDPTLPAGNYTGNYSRGFAGDYTGDFTGNYTRDFAGDYTGNYGRDFVGNFTGNYSRTFAGDYVGNYTRNYTRDRISTYSRTRVSQAYTRNRISTYTRTRDSAYTRNRISTYTRNRASVYARTRTSNYSSNFTRTSTRTFEGNYTGTELTSGTGTAETYTLYLRTA